MPSAETVERRLREIEELARGWGEILAQEAFPDGVGLDVDLFTMEEFACTAAKALVGGAVETMTQRSAVDPGVEVRACPRDTDVVAVLQPGAGSVTRANLWAGSGCCLSAGGEARGSHEDGGDEAGGGRCGNASLRTHDSAPFTGSCLTLTKLFDAVGRCLEGMCRSCGDRASPPFAPLKR